MSNEHRAKETRDSIALSFFPILEQDVSFNVYYHPSQPEDTKTSYPECSLRWLPIPPITDATKKGAHYWVTFDHRDNFTLFSCSLDTNKFIAVDYLYRLLIKSCEQNLSSQEYALSHGFRSRQVAFILERFQEGDQTVWLEPYYLQEEQRYGFLCDFKFAAPPNSIPTRHSLQLSLSLDKAGRSNRNFYADRHAQLQRFITKYFHKISPLQGELTKITVRKTLLNLRVHSLDTKRYMFANDRVATSQFMGLKEHGPQQKAPDNPKIYFVFRNQDRSFSLDLYRALKGDTYHSTFSGMEGMFRFPFENASGNVGGEVVAGFDPDSIKKALDTIQNDAKGRPVIPVFIIPFHREGGDSDSRSYYIAKHTLLKRHIPSQFVTLQLLQSKNNLKWSVGGIGLQLFAKMGGQPWKVVPATENCLIVGIGQAHKKINKQIEKYFAYSVLTESTGLYKKLKVLGQSPDQEKYMGDFKKNLREVIEEYYDDYENFVVHTRFSIRREELAAITDVLEEMNRPEGPRKNFVVIKFNEHSKFFGYSTVNNSMVPFESSYIQLSRREFLVWFEGLQYHNPNIRSQIQRPLHVKFIYSSTELNWEQRRVFLQDAINISGANWRGFNAKSLPVSIYYAKLVADFYKEFQALGLEEIDLENITPWFL